MEQTKKILNITISISMVLLSLSAFIYSVKSATAKTASAKQIQEANGYVVVGAVCNSRSNGLYVLLYNPTTGQAKKVEAR